MLLAQDNLPARFLHGSGASMMALSQALSANAQIAAAMMSGGGADRRDRGSRKSSMKAFNKVAKFTQGEAQWMEFHFDFGADQRRVHASARNLEGCGADDGRDRHADGESS